MDDWIIADSGIIADKMYWRKWASGWAELWGAVKETGCTTFNSDKYYDITFPFTFNSIWALVTGASDSKSIGQQGATNTLNIRNSTTSGCTLCYRGSAISATGYLNYYIAGKY